MESLSVPRILLAGVGSGVGKSLIGIGLAHELRRRGVSVSCAVVGPSLLQSIIYRRISGRYVHCFDGRLLSPRQNLSGCYLAGVGADIVLIEGRGGLYDSLEGQGLVGPDAQMASMLEAPVVLVLDVRGIRQGVAAILRGFVEYSAGFEFAGVLLNKFSGGRDKAGAEAGYLRNALKDLELPPILGLIPLLEGEQRLPQDLVRQGISQTSLPLSLYMEISNLVREFIDVDSIIRAAGAARNVKVEGFDHAPAGRRCKIAVSEDSCFCICFQDNLDLLRYYGAEVIAFSPLADEALPKGVGAVYLSGAYLPDYAQELAANDSMKKSLRKFADGGGVIFSEGAGTAYLCEQFETAPGEWIDGAGLIPGKARISETSIAYIESVTVEESVLGRAGLIVKGINTGEWSLEKDAGIVKTLRISRQSQKVIEEGYSPGAQILATFSLLHLGSNPAVAKNIVDAAEVVKKVG